MQLTCRKRFLGWLSSKVPSSPIFHISGKLGSGKSILMKFLFSHPITTDKLEKWAGTRKLAFTSFFFWRNGSMAQRSLDGLCRSILHGVLKERHDLIPEVFPLQWKEAEESPRTVQNRQDLSSREVKHTLKKLLQDTQLYQHHKFYIFINSLNEFKPRLQNGLDYVNLVDILCRWASYSNSNLKLCLSSRKDPVFLNAFRDSPNFRLQDLTRFDMQNYVCGRLSKLTEVGLKERFIDTIPERSSGIFLWVYLIVKAIRNKMTHKATNKALTIYLETLPQGLESLFDHILQGLELDNKRKTLQIIACLKVTKSNDMELPLTAFSLLDDYIRDANFSTREGLEAVNRPDESTIQTQLRGACGGLLESNHGKQLWPSKVIDFVHRSVPDMFEKHGGNPTLAREMEAALSDINCVDLATQLCFNSVRLQWLDTVPSKEFPNDRSYERQGFRDVCIDIALARLTGVIDKPPYQFLDCISYYIDDGELEEELTASDNAIWVDILCPFRFYRQHRGEFNGAFLDFTCLAAYGGSGGYLDWKISNDSFVLNNCVKRALIGQSVLMLEDWDMFFRYSIFSEDATIPLRPCFAKQATRKTWHLLDYSGDLTAWQFFLVRAITCGGRSPVQPPTVPVNIIARFLKQGADPYCQIQVERRSGMKVYSITIYFRQAHIKLKGYPLRDETRDIMGRCQASRGRPKISWRDFRECFSLQEWVAGTNWEDRDNLVDVLECSSKRSKDKTLSLLLR